MRPHAPEGRREGLWKLWVASSGLLLFLAVPLLSLLTVLRPGAWLAQLRSETAMQALALTLQTTAVSTLLCVLLGLPVAYLLARAEFRGREIVDTLVDLPITIPPVVAGVALLLAFGRNGLLGRTLDLWGVQIAFTSVAVVMAQVFIACPFFVKTARAGFAAVDPRLESAAHTLGANRWRAFWTVMLPLARPSLVAGTALAWARALSEFGATMMFAGNVPGRTQTLPLAVMTAMETDLETAVAVSILALLLAVVALIAARTFARRWSVPGV
ncbi:MAG: ABC transporter permease [Armatimonadetes bacterium]|nr:ABC transporter permease [Armatimonadota bacterium]